MVGAYVMIQTEVGKSRSVSTGIRELAGVVDTDEVTGPYDIICKLQAESVEELGTLVLARLQEIPGITRTLTCTVVHS